MNDNEIKAAFRFLAEGIDPERAADAVRKEIGQRSETIAEKEGSGMKKGRKWTAVLAAAALVAVLGAAVTAAPMIRNYLNTRVLQEDSVQRLEEVPDGWIGVYSLDDMDAVREDLAGNYILMEDLAFDPADFEAGGRFEGGWEPIGTWQEPFIGIFNGNGHTIDGLRIDVRADGNAERGRIYAGLFGYVVSNQGYETEMIYNDTPKKETVEIDLNGDGIMETVEMDLTPSSTLIHFKDWGVSGTVKNLRLTNGSVRAVYPAKAWIVAVGPIAGSADYVLGCSVEGFTVTAEVSGPYDSGYLDDVLRQPLSLTVGGVAGQTYLVDSCCSGADLFVSAPEDLPGDCTCTAGGITGLASACVTSYFNGTVSGNADDCGPAKIRDNDLPRFLPAPVMDEVFLRLLFTKWENFVSGNESKIIYSRPDNFDSLVERARKEGITAENFYTLIEESDIERLGFEDEGWLGTKFLCWYRSNDPESSEITDEAVQDHYTNDAEGVRFYILEPTIKPREYTSLSKLISAAFPDGDFMDFCREMNVKYGMYDAYDLRFDPDCAFEGFDFDTVWTWGKDGGLPVLRLFK